MTKWMNESLLRKSKSWLQKNFIRKRPKSSKNDSKLGFVDISSKFDFRTERKSFVLQKWFESRTFFGQVRILSWFVFLTHWAHSMKTFEVKLRVFFTSNLFYDAPKNTQIFTYFHWIESWSQWSELLLLNIHDSFLQVIIIIFLQYKLATSQHWMGSKKH